MLDVAWPELLVIGAVTLVAVGPKDLPRVMHKLGTWAGKLRHYGLAVQRTFEQLEEEAAAEEKTVSQKHDAS